MKYSTFFLILSVVATGLFAQQTTPGPVNPDLMQRNFLDMRSDVSRTDARVQFVAGEFFVDANATLLNAAELIFKPVAIGFTGKPGDIGRSMYALAVRWDLTGHLQLVDFELQYRFQLQGQWSQWTALPPGHDVMTDPENTFVSELVFFSPDASQYQLKLLLHGTKRPIVVKSLMSDLIAPPQKAGTSDTDLQNEKSSEQQKAPGQINSKNKPAMDKPAKDGVSEMSCPCPQPAYLTRASWCSGGCAPICGLSVTIPTHLIVHHSAANHPPGTDYSGVVQGIYVYHTATNGWCDIGYNWLVDPNGVVYEGRGNDILGAHMCAANSYTMGICVLGDFTSIVPTTAALDKLTQWLAWECCDKGIDPLTASWHSPSGKNLNHISGHRDGCSPGYTECPGNSFYPMLPSVRIDVDNEINSCGAASCATPSNLQTVEGLHSVSISWDPVAGATSYQIQGKKAVTGSWQSKNITGTSQYIGGLGSGTTYKWKVRASCSGDISEFSGVQTFTTLTLRVENPDFDMTVYPNPADQMLQVDYTADFSSGGFYEITDVFGRIVRKGILNEYSGRQHFQISLEGLPAGIFGLQLYSSVNANLISTDLHKTFVKRGQ